MKILTDDHWDVLMEHQEWLKARVKELEAANLGLVDRLLVQQGQLPLNMELGNKIEEQEKAHNDLIEQLTVEEIGEEPKDEPEVS